MLHAFDERQTFIWPLVLRRHHVVPLILVVVLFSLRASAQQRTEPSSQLVEQGATAFQEHRFAAALEAFSKATTLQPGGFEGWLWRGLAEYMMGHNEESETSLMRAVTLQPRLVEASLLLGQVQYASGRLPAAIATYEAALQRAPGEQRLASTLTKWKAEDQLQSRFYESRGAHFRVLFEGPADDALARRVVEILEAAYWRVGETLSTYPTQTIEVVLYTLEQFHDVTRSPAWAAAAYDGRVRVPARNALQQPGVLERLLVHELVHAFVARLGGRSVPTWLNEGLAVNLEPNGLEQAEHVLATLEIRVPLRELHGGFAGLSGDRAYVAYAESAIAVKRMMDLRDLSAVVTLLKDLASGADFATAFHQRIAVPYDEFQQLIAQQ